MKLLQIIPTLNPEEGGPIDAVLRLSDALAELGAEVTILSLDSPPGPDVGPTAATVMALGDRAHAGRSAMAKARNWLRYGDRALEWGKQNLAAFDAVVVHSLWNNSTNLARRLFRGSGTPYVVYPHGMLDPWFSRQQPMKHLAKQLLWFFNEGPLLRDADHVLFTCEQERLLARNTFVPYRVNERVVAFGAGEPPPADPEQERTFRALLPQLGDRKYLLFLSRIHVKKGCDLLVDAFAANAASHPDIDLVMAGPDQQGLAAALKQKAHDLGIGDRVHWPGMVSGSAKYGAYRGAEAFVLPSHQENFGIVVAEALACSCPVLISNQVNIWREIEQGNAGLVAPDSVAGTQDMLCRFLSLSAIDRREFGLRGRGLYQRSFTSRAAGLDLYDVLQSAAISRANTGNRKTRT